mmetsp:Transcript_20969/g.31797  ORF Transcript_20969/g.31797 Transcript_20969/m.31797 type:complete len:303 (+) Transcript_20969:85-993(+)
MSNDKTTRERILVIGATGMLGEPVVRSLSSDGHMVRAMSRTRSRAAAIFGDDKNIEIIQGNIADLESLAAAMKDCTGVHINLSGGEESIGAINICKVLVAVEPSNCDVKRITLISGVSTCKKNTWYSGTKAKLEAEQAIIASGVAYTIFRCTMFMETLPKWQYLIGNQSTVKWHWIAAQDYASMVSKSFTTLAASHKIFFIYGPGPARTLEEALDQVYLPMRASEEGKTKPTIPKYSVWWMKLQSWMTGNKELRNVTIRKFEWLSRISELGSPEEANDLLGAPSMTIEMWCEAFIKSNQKTM